VVDDVTGLIVGAEYNAQTPLSGIPAIVMACVKPLAIDYTMFVNLFEPYAIMTAQIHWWKVVDIAKIDPAHRKSDPPRAYISVVNESSE